jgi:hypothetical protein
MARPRSQNPQGAASVTIKIPRPLYEQLAQVIGASGFRSVTEFVVYVLRDLVAARETAHEAELSPDEVELVRKRLQALGYL